MTGLAAAHLYLRRTIPRGRASFAHGTAVPRRKISLLARAESGGCGSVTNDRGNHQVWAASGRQAWRMSHSMAFLRAGGSGMAGSGGWRQAGHRRAEVRGRSSAARVMVTLHVALLCSCACKMAAASSASCMPAYGHCACLMPLNKHQIALHAKRTCCLGAEGLYAARVFAPRCGAQQRAAATAASSRLAAARRSRHACGTP